MKIVIVASRENAYVRAIVSGAIDRGLEVSKILIGSKAENFLFKVNSLRRIYSRLGWREVLRRLITRNSEIYGLPSPLQSLRACAAAAGVAVVEYDFVNGGAVLAELAEARGGVVVLAGCGIVDKAFIAAANGNCINGHPALLPGLRGVDVVEWALYRGVKTGVTAHRVEPSVDAGEIIVTKDVPIVSGEAYLDFRRRILIAQANVVVEALSQLVTGQARPIAHDISQSEICFAASDEVRRDAVKKYLEATKTITP